MAKSQGFIKIIGTPTGDAPEFVKKACVGLVLPFYDRADPETSKELEVNSGELREIRKGAFCVDREVLLAELKKVDFVAESWLRQNCPRGNFSFGPEIVKEVQRQVAG